MRLGLIARADRTGLGYQTKAYYDHLKPHKTIVVDISELNGNQQNYHWYDPHNNRIVIKGLIKRDYFDVILDDIDVLLTAETFYSLELITYAKRKGVKTICVDNPEFFDKAPLPDLIILPSNWLEDKIREWAEPRGTKVIQLHHPVDRDIYHYRERTTNKTYHIAGKPATLDRNGTWNYIKAEPTGKVITQDETFAMHIRKRYRHSQVYTGIDDNVQMYDYGDIMVLPRKYGGNCLPLNEALSRGCPVIMPDVAPNNNLLLKEWLVPVRSAGVFAPRGENIAYYECEAPALTQTIKRLQAQDIKQLSRQANEIADTISWTTLLPKWKQAINDL